jgi:hypothetical protein
VHDSKADKEEKPKEKELTKTLQPEKKQAPQKDKVNKPKQKKVEEVKEQEKEQVVPATPKPTKEDLPLEKGDGLTF